MPSPHLRLLRDNRDFRRLFIAQLISLGGDWFSTVALLGLVIELTGSEFLAAVVIVANRLPFFFLAPLAGVVADRFDRKKLMIATDIARALVALGMLAARTPETVWMGIVSMAGITALSSFFTPASQAALPNLVRPEDLSAANVLTGASFGTMLAVGSALGGLVAASLGRDAAFLINSASFLVSGLLIVGIKGKFVEKAPEGPARPLRDIREGIAYARSEPRVMALLATKAGFGLGAGVIVLLSVFATKVFHAGDAGIGFLFAARGLGTLIGPFVSRSFVGDKERRLFLAIGFSMGLFGLAYLIFPAVPSLWLALPVVVLAHTGGGSQWMLSSYGLQSMTPDKVRGRIFSFDFALVTLTLSVSTLLAGRAAEVFDVRIVALVFAAVEVLYAIGWTAATGKFWRQTRSMAEEPEDDIAEHPLIREG